MLQTSIFPAIRELFADEKFYLQQDGAPPNYHQDVRAYLDDTTWTMDSKCLRVPTDQLENVVNEICSDDDSGDEIMIPELDEVDSDNNTVIDNDPQDSNHEHLPTTSAVPDTPIS
ncbi:hypothetical protein B7P43_G07962 [Cryptotermes secundus]|uniref:Uncharacterized protein n=1 Tax=Cryptotermes secundus TaxID=105785 RepID=A0A2J7Q8S3_9NEOP|nr:hypothetical protein B7P43_G07962 [Cryptotermes secundus]